MEFLPAFGTVCRNISSPESKRRIVGSPKLKLCCELQLKRLDVSLQAVSEAAMSWLSSSGLTIALGLHDPARVGVSLLAETCSAICIEPAIPGGDYPQLHSPGGKRDQGFSAVLAGSSSSSIESNPMVFPYCQAHITVLPYFLHKKKKEGGILEMEEEGSVSIFQQWTLPNQEFENLWKNLYFDDAIKATLLEYTSTALIFSDKNVDSKLISWNRLVLLHGPPGSGKTSLCKALAQKLAIRLTTRFTTSFLLSINSPSLFSRWFSESGKRVMQAFQEIRQLLKDKDCLVVILIDEVESLSASRASAASSEPSDFVRVVNALLTQIDLLSPYPNALVLTTSNLTESCDPAFIDRADLKLFIPSPNAKCRREILVGCIQELIRVGLLAPCKALSSPDSLKHSFGGCTKTKESELLLSVVNRSEGISGRSMRKLPFLAYGCVSALVSTLASLGEVADLCVSSRLARQAFPIFFRLCSAQLKLTLKRTRKSRSEADFTKPLELLSKLLTLYNLTWSSFKGINEDKRILQL